MLTLAYGDSATVRVTNVGRRRRQNPDIHGYMIDVTTGRWLKENEPEDQAVPEEEGLEVPAESSASSGSSPTSKTAATFWSPGWAAVEPDTAITAAIALERGIEAAFQLEDSELASERLPDPDHRGRALLIESAEGGAGVLRRLVDDPGALARAARTALQIMHFDPDTGADLSVDEAGRPERCVRACYDCLLSYSNQRVHEHDQPASRPRPDAPAGPRRGGPPGRPAATASAEPGNRRAAEFVAWLSARDLRLPDEVDRDAGGAGPTSSTGCRTATRPSSSRSAGRRTRAGRPRRASAR